ncbi:MAG: hypothetical protein RXO43_03895, partial [Candidatus Micrarchaeota archaeon]
WVNLPNGIPASSSLTIYLGFASKTTNLLSNSGTSGIGEAPQLSSTYGQYDDGAKVFNVYLNFAGTTLPSGFISAKSSDGTFSINNGLTMGTGTNVAPSYSYLVSTSLYPPQLVEYYLASIISNPNGFGGIGTDSGFSSSTSPAANDNNNFYNFSGGSIVSSSGSWYYNLVNNGGVILSTNGAFNTGIYTSNINPFQYYLNYNLVASNTIAVTNSLYLFLGISSFGSSAYNPRSESILVDWLRTRALPPNGVMPSVSFGSLSSA